MKATGREKKKGAKAGRQRRLGPQPHKGAKRAPRRAARTPGATPRPKLLGESIAARRARALRLWERLRTAYPGATTELRHNSAYELLVATILSAQCTDERVNRVTPNFFRRWPDARTLADAAPGELEAVIRPTGFYRNKARSLLGLARIVRDEFGGRIPDTMAELLRLPGVARKTANCVLGTWFRKNEGIVVDTHVGRLAERLGLMTTGRNSKDAERIEQDLMVLFPRDWWTHLSHALILHGRCICTARKPKCAECTLAADCPSRDQSPSGGEGHAGKLA